MTKIIKNINEEDINIIKALQKNNSDIMKNLEDVYKMIYIEKSISIDINNPNQKAFSELVQTAHYMNFKNNQN